MTTKQHCRIFMLSPASHMLGSCGVCGTLATLKFRDASTGVTVAQCCLNDLLLAEAMLTATFKDGLRHPTVDEAENNH